MRIIAVLLSIVMPGVGQIFNGHLVKAFIYIFFAHTINTLAGINQAIYLDFNGYHKEALRVLNFQFALFYPGFYVLGLWDAFQDAKPNPNKKAGIFYIMAGLSGSLSTIFSSYLSIPTLIIGLSIIIPVLIGTVIFKD